MTTGPRGSVECVQRAEDLVGLLGACPGLEFALVVEDRFGWFAAHSDFVEAVRLLRDLPCRDPAVPDGLRHTPSYPGAEGPRDVTATVESWLRELDVLGANYHLAWRAAPGARPRLDHARHVSGDRAVYEIARYLRDGLFQAVGV